MKGLIGLVGVVICLGLAVSPALADPPAGVQPACADITSDITGAGFTGTEVFGALGVRDLTCQNVNYTMVVFTYNARGIVSGVTAQTLRGDGQDTFVPLHVTTASSQYACVFFVTSIGFHVLDVAPDTGCPLRINVPGRTNPFNVLTPDTAPGGGFFN